MMLKIKKILFGALMLYVILQLGACSISNIQDGAPKQYVDVSKIPNAVPKVEPRSRFGNPATYVVNGRRYYVLRNAKGYNKTGIASWYGTKFHGHLTSDREIYDMFGMTAASTELPLPTYVKVTNLSNGRQVIVKVNDRGPFDKDRILDLSYAAAIKLGYERKGTAPVRVTAIDPRIWQARHGAHATTTVTRVAISHTPKLYLQIGAFADPDNANRLQQQLVNFVHEPLRITKGQYRNRPIYRVQIGPLNNVDENDRLQQMLANHGFGRAMTVVQ